MRWGNKNMSNWDPTRFSSETTVFSAADKTRNKILDMTFSMNEKVSSYLQYHKVGRMMPMACEEAQASVQELYSLIRESVLLWIDERQRKIQKIRTMKKDQSELLLRLEDELGDDKKILIALDELDNGGSATDKFLVLAKRFLNKYVYQRGISKLEIENKEPADEYAKEAYGNSYTEEDA